MLLDIIYHIAEVLLSIIKEFGYVGIFIGMTIESSFIPFPSEIILIPAGVLVAQGEMNFFLILIAGLLGSLLGALINYFLALHFGRRTIDALVSRYGKILFISKSQIDKSDEYFKKHGEITTLIGRFIPAIRQLVSIPAGFSRMNLFKFCIFTGIGAGIWVTVLIYIGYLFGNNSELIKQNINLASLILIVISLIVVIIYITTKRKSKFKAPHLPSQKIQP